MPRQLPSVIITVTFCEPVEGQLLIEMGGQLLIEMCQEACKATRNGYFISHRGAIGQASEKAAHHVRVVPSLNDTVIKPNRKYTKVLVISHLWRHTSHNGTCAYRGQQCQWETCTDFANELLAAFRRYYNSLSAWY